jgi:hypothetical protein
MRGVWVVLGFGYFFWGAKGGRCKGGEKNLLPLPTACPRKEDGKQCHQNATVLRSFFFITVNKTTLFCTNTSFHLKENGAKNSLFPNQFSIFNWFN